MSVSVFIYIVVEPKTDIFSTCVSNNIARLAFIFCFLFFLRPSHRNLDKWLKFSNIHFNGNPSSFF